MGLVYEDVADVGAVQPLLFLSTQPSRVLPQSDALPAFCVFRNEAALFMLAACPAASGRTDETLLFLPTASLSSTPLFPFFHPFCPRHHQTNKTPDLVLCAKEQDPRSSATRSNCCVSALRTPAVRRPPIWRHRPSNRSTSHHGVLLQSKHFKRDVLLCRKHRDKGGLHPLREQRHTGMAVLHDGESLSGIGRCQRVLGCKVYVFLSNSLVSKSKPLT